MNPLLAFKAEVVLAIHLITRHRAPRLAMVLAFGAIALLVAEGRVEASATARRQIFVFIAGAVSAIAASRLLANGPARSSVRRTGSHPLLAPTGRLVGLLLLAAPGIAAISLALIVLGDDQSARLLIILPLYCAGIGAMAMSVTPALGASGAAIAGVLLAVAAGDAAPIPLLLCTAVGALASAGVVSRP